MPNQTNWIPLRETRLRELYADPEKLSVAEITRRLNDETIGNFSPKAVMGKIVRLGIADRRDGETVGWTPESIAFMVEQYLSRAQPSYAVIAKRINASYGTNFTRCAITGKVNRLGLANRKFDGPRQVLPRQPRIPVARKTSRRKPLEFDRAPELRVVELEPRAPGITIIDLEKGECHWPVHSEGELHFFCGHPAATATDVSGRAVAHAYCSHHRMRSIGTGTASERRATKVSAAA